MEMQNGAAKNFKRMLKLKEISGECWHMNHKNCDGNASSNEKLSFNGTFIQCTCKCHK